MIATAPGKLILTGEYAVLDGAPALVIAVDRRVTARRGHGPRGSSAFLLALADELGRRFGADHPATRAALEVVVDSSSFYAGTQKLGLGSSAAVTVAATALALAADHVAVPVIDPPSATLRVAARPGGAGAIDRAQVLAIASAAHTAAQDGRGSGADIAAAVYGGVIAFQRAAPDAVAWPSDAAAAGHAIAIGGATADRLAWPAGLTLLPFFSGSSADTPALIRAVSEARASRRIAVDAALTSIVKASRLACQACAARVPEVAAPALLAALTLAGHAIDQLASATGIALVPQNVAAARTVLAQLGGTAKTTGAGGGDIAIAVIPTTEDATAAKRYLIDAGCQPLELAVDQTGVDLQPDAQ